MNKFKKPKEIEIAEFYGNTTQTLRNYRDSEDEKLRRRYSALREYYVNQREENETSNTKS